MPIKELEILKYSALSPNVCVIFMRGVLYYNAYLKKIVFY